MPERDLRRNARYTALRMMATMIEPRCLIGRDGAAPLFQAAVVKEGKWFLRNRNRSDRRNLFGTERSRQSRLVRNAKTVTNGEIRDNPPGARKLPRGAWILSAEH